MLHHRPTASRGGGAAPRREQLSASWEMVPDPPSNPSNDETEALDTLEPSAQQLDEMPPSWRDEYLTSLRESEKNNPVNKDLVIACSQLNDRIAALEAEKAAWQASSSPSPLPPSAASRNAPAGGEDKKTDGTAAAADPILSRLRVDLAEALRARGQLESRLRKAEEERDQLRSSRTSDGRALREATAERNALRVKLRDKEEELRGKNKMLEDLQDEVLALNLQLNVAEQQKAKVQAENKQLVERWMKRVGQEAEAMNLANEPIFAKRR